jgi:hypothetical protein
MDFQSSQQFQSSDVSKLIDIIVASTTFMKESRQAEKDIIGTRIEELQQYIASHRKELKEQMRREVHDSRQILTTYLESFKSLIAQNLADLQNTRAPQAFDDTKTTQENLERTLDRIIQDSSRREESVAREALAVAHQCVASIKEAADQRTEGRMTRSQTELFAILQRQFECITNLQNHVEAHISSMNSGIHSRIQDAIQQSLPLLTNSGVDNEYRENFRMISHQVQTLAASIGQIQEAAVPQILGPEVLNEFGIALANHIAQQQQQLQVEWRAEFAQTQRLLEDRISNVAEHAIARLGQVHPEVETLMQNWRSAFLQDFHRSQLQIQDVINANHRIQITFNEKWSDELRQFNQFQLESREFRNQLMLAMADTVRRSVQSVRRGIKDSEDSNADGAASARGEGKQEARP